MRQPGTFMPIEGAMIQSVVLVDRLTRSMPCRFQSVSLPGHLLQVVVEGEVEQEVSGCRRRLVPGTAVWYHENEAVRGRICQAPWTFYTVNFHALRLLPPPFEQCVWAVGPQACTLFQSLLGAWRNVAVPPQTRHLQVYSLLMQLLLEVLPAETRAHRTDVATHLWWEIETRLREDLGQPIDLRRIQVLSQRSLRSITRSCRMAVGMSPIKRVKEIRLSYARGLVLYSHLSMTEIALRVGYGRVQELSRDYHQRFGMTPRADRMAGPDYAQQRER